MKIYESLLAFREAVVAKEGKVIRVVLDKKGNEALRDELDVSIACSKMLFGILVDVAKDRPTCRQSMAEEAG